MSQSGTYAMELVGALHSVSGPLSSIFRTDLNVRVLNLAAFVWEISNEGCHGASLAVQAVHHIHVYAARVLEGFQFGRFPENRQTANLKPCQIFLLYALKVI